MVVTRESKYTKAATSYGRNSLKQMNIFYIINRNLIDIQNLKKNYLLVLHSTKHKVLKRIWIDKNTNCINNPCQIAHQE
jgi:hypothetical protein